MNHTSKPAIYSAKSLTFGFNMVIETGDWKNLLALCGAVQLDHQGQQRSVIVPAEKAQLFVRLIEKRPFVTDLHGRTTQGGRVELPAFLKGNNL